MKKAPEYNWSDAWLLLAVIYAGPEGATLERIIEVGNGIEHAIFNPDELESGLARLTAGGHLQEKAGVFFATSGVMTGYQKTTSLRRSIQKELSDIEKYLGAVVSRSASSFKQPAVSRIHEGGVYRSCQQLPRATSEVTRLLPSRLADWTVKRRASRLGDAPDPARAASASTPFTFAVVDDEALRSLTAHELIDRPGQDGLDGAGELMCARQRRAAPGGNRRRPQPWRQASAVERFARIDVAEAGDDGLFEQGDFDRPAGPCTRGGERGAVKCCGQRFRTQTSDRR
jgi:hypothetical protein